MPIPRPRICTRLTIPTGGWAFQCDASQAGQYDTACDITLAAGDYFVSGDGQTDDLLFELCTKMQAELVAEIGVNAYVGASIDPGTHKVHILFCGDEFEGATKSDFKIDWPNCAAGLAAALGFDTAAVDTSENDDHPEFTADWEAGYNWFASEDGQLTDLRVEDASTVEALQSFAIDGTSKTQKIAERFSNAMLLEYIERDRMNSRNVGYGTAPVYPYVRNRALECWWQEAQQGVEFRVYRDGYIATVRAADQGPIDADDTTTLTDGAKAWGVEPQDWAGALLYLPDWGENSAKNTIPMTYHLASNTATILTLTAAHPSGLDVMGTGSADVYYLFHHRYQTYVVDIAGMNAFEPEEMGALDRYRIQIPLRRYV